MRLARSWSRKRSALTLRPAPRRLSLFSPQKGRGERFLLPMADGPATIIDESYNANPASMRAALALLAATKPGPKGRRIAVIGDMLELGPKAAAMHAELAADLSANNVDLAVWRGPAHARFVRGGAGVDARCLDGTVKRVD